MVHVLDLVREPAVTVGRIFAGVAPALVPEFLAAQVVGGVLGPALVVALYPDAPRAAGSAVGPAGAGSHRAADESGRQ